MNNEINDGRCRCFGASTGAGICDTSRFAGSGSFSIEHKLNCDWQVVLWNGMDLNYIKLTVTLFFELFFQLT